jgi:hypothetical protein
MMRSPSQRVICAAFALTFSAGAASAQWSPDPGENLTIADRSGPQVQPKVRATADGGTYVSWLDNAFGGYDTYVQRLDAQGNEMWATNGVLVIDTGFSSTQDYGFVAAPSGDAAVAFRDDTSGGSHVGVQVITPDGDLAWGPNGVRVTTSSTANVPRLAALSDGAYAVGWTQGAGFFLQRLSAAGVPQWQSGGIGSTPATGSYTLAELMPGENGSVIALWVRPTGGFSSPRHLYMQKYDASGAALWNSGNPLVIFDASSVQLGYFPTFLPDGQGGAVIGWYENGGGRRAYVQRVTSDGQILLPAGGMPVSLDADRIRLDPSVAFDQSTGDIYLAWPQANTNQSQWGVAAQRITAEGVRAWGDSGRIILPLSGMQPSFVRSVYTQGALQVYWFDRPMTPQVVGTALDADGVNVWSPEIVTVSSVPSGKGRLDVAASALGCAIVAWSDARNDDGDIIGASVRSDGTLGACDSYCPADFNNDGGVDGADVEAFFTAWEAGDSEADVNGDGGIDGADVETFFVAWEAGGC